MIFFLFIVNRGLSLLRASDIIIAGVTTTTWRFMKTIPWKCHWCNIGTSGCIEGKWCYIDGGCWDVVNFFLVNQSRGSRWTDRGWHCFDWDDPCLRCHLRGHCCRRFWFGFGCRHHHLCCWIDHRHQTRAKMEDGVAAGCIRVAMGAYKWSHVIGWFLTRRHVQSRIVSVTL